MKVVENSEIQSAPAKAYPGHRGRIDALAQVVFTHTYPALCSDALQTASDILAACQHTVA